MSEGRNDQSADVLSIVTRVARRGAFSVDLCNVFIVIPQLLVATVMGSVLKAFFPAEPIWTMASAAIVMTLAALAMLRVAETGDS